MAEKRKTKTSSAVKTAIIIACTVLLSCAFRKRWQKPSKKNAPQQVRRKHKLSRKRLNSSWKNKRNNGGWQDLPPFFFWRKEERECTSI